MCALTLYNAAMQSLPTLESLDVSGKTVLVRLDLNVPMQGGRVLDATRIARIVPTLQYLLERDAKVVVLSHLGRPKSYDPALSLAPLVDALSSALWDRSVKFAPDCIGNAARLAVENAAAGDVILMENLRFHAAEEAGDETFAAQLASLAQCYVNDAFSCSHRAHASIVGIAKHLPSAAGRLLEEEVRALSKVLTAPELPLCAIVGGSKISTKLELLGNLTSKVQTLVIGGAMANTFLLAQGYGVGTSLVEKEMVATAKEILAKAAGNGCNIILPSDVLVANALKPHAASRVCDVQSIPDDAMILDIGPASLAHLFTVIAESRTLVWNGPLGAYEIQPFDSSTTQLARIVAKHSRAGTLHSVAGGGDTVAALAYAGLSGELSYLSTAGGAFLEWLEGKTLPGIAALMKLSADADARRACA
jgi:phosphoglycerate kinase